MSEKIRNRIAALQADNERLREALETAKALLTLTGFEEGSAIVQTIEAALARSGGGA